MSNKCTMCGSDDLSSRGHKLWFCNGCHNLTDCEDDGVVGYKRPERNASSKEEFEQRKKARGQRRKRPSHRRF